MEESESGLTMVHASGYVPLPSESEPPYKRDVIHLNFIEILRPLRKVWFDEKIGDRPLTEFIVEKLDPIIKKLFDDNRIDGTSLIKPYLNIMSHGALGTDPTGTDTRPVEFEYNINRLQAAPPGCSNRGNKTSRDELEGLYEKTLPENINYDDVNSLKINLFLIGSSSEIVFKQINENRRNLKQVGSLPFSTKKYDCLFDTLISEAEVDEAIENLLAARKINPTNKNEYRNSALQRLPILNNPTAFNSYGGNVIDDKILTYSKNDVFEGDPGIYLHLIFLERPDLPIIKISLLKQFTDDGSVDSPGILLSNSIKLSHYISEHVNLIINKYYKKNTIGISIIDFACSNYLKQKQLTPQQLALLKANVENRPKIQRKSTILEKANALKQAIPLQETQPEETQPEETQPEETQSYDDEGKLGGGKKIKQLTKRRKRKSKRKTIIKRQNKRRTKRRTIKSKTKSKRRN